MLYTVCKVERFVLTFIKRRLLLLLLLLYKAGNRALPRLLFYFSHNVTWHTQPLCVVPLCEVS